MTPDDAAPLLARFAAWGVEPRGEPWRTPSSVLALGERAGRPVVGKLALVEEERRGARLLASWSGRGAVRVLERDDDAVLMARAAGRRDPAAWAASGRDDAATGVLVDVALALHRAPSPPADVGLVPLEAWFGALRAAPRSDPLLAVAASVAADLLAATGPDDRVALHGDLHHGNVLDDAADPDADPRSGWVAIDPKALHGHRAFDFANLLLNPRADLAVTRLDRRLDLVAARTGLEREVLAAWTLAWCGLSLAWRGGDEADDHARAARLVGARLAAALRRS